MWDANNNKLWQKFIIIKFLTTHCLHLFKYIYIVFTHIFCDKLNMYLFHVSRVSRFAFDIMMFLLSPLITQFTRWRITMIKLEKIVSRKHFYDEKKIR